MQKEEYNKMYELENTHWWFVAKRHFISQVFPKGRKFKILDIGAGTGETTKFLGKYGRVSGIEPNKLARNLANERGIKLIAGSAEKLPFKNNSFDVTTLFDVLYHKGVKNDLEALKETYRVLKPQGYLIITDSALQFLLGPHDEAFHARKRYTKKELIKKAEAAGFRIEKASYIFFFLFPLIFLKRISSKIKAKLIKNLVESDVKEVPFSLNSLLINICALEAKLLQHFNFPVGSTIIIRAIKS